MTFSSRITRCPIPHNPERGAEALARLSGQPREIAELIRGATGCSPYLAGLAQREADWLGMVLSGSPQDALLGVLDPLPEIAPDRLSDELRQAKRRVALLVALCDLGGIWALEDVTVALTRFADLAVDLSVKAQVGAEIRRGRLPGMSPDDVPDAAGMVALAMGKMGAGELNYSSDIDLICLFDETRFDPGDYHDARAGFIRATRRMTAQLSDMTGEGYVFRTDLRLRPDPSATPVCLSMEAAERYYESVGRTWERAAHIKARPCAGDLKAAERYLERLRPFVWRRHLDFAAIQDAHDMRLRIRDHKGLGGPITLPGHNIKLGRGGIREIEFLTQTSQIIAGGRDPDLRVRETLKGLARLAAKGWLPEECSVILCDNYVFYRETEHRLQMIGDAQTHDLPGSDEGFERLAHLMGRTDVDALKRELFDRLTGVHELTEGFFTPGEAAPEPESLSDDAARMISRWRSYPALRSERAQDIFNRIKPEILTRMNRAARPEEALGQFDRFLAGLPAGVQILSLFEASGRLIDLLVDICATSPALARHLSRNSGVLDAVLCGSFFVAWPGVDGLDALFSETMAAADDYENKLDAIRRAHREWHFRVGVHHLRGLVDAQEAGRQYSDLAEAVIRTLWRTVIREFARKYGPPPGNGAVVLGMGSLGARNMNARSDLDLIVVYDAGGAEGSDGPRPLMTRPYYARLVQALVTALTAPMAGGKLYDVDMRLRPSGRQGPVATSFESFQSYQMSEAWTWEHLALTRARGVAGPDMLAASVEAFRRRLLSEKGVTEKVLSGVIDMRARLAEARPATAQWEARLGPGGMQDIELLAEAGALMTGCHETALAGQLAAAAGSGWLSGEEAETLSSCYALLWKIRIGSRLISEKPLDMNEIGEGGRSFILRETGAADTGALRLRFSENTAASDAVITGALSRKPAGGRA